MEDGNLGRSFERRETNFSTRRLQPNCRLRSTEKRENGRPGKIKCLRGVLCRIRMLGRHWRRERHAQQNIVMRIFTILCNVGNMLFSFGYDRQ